MSAQNITRENERGKVEFDWLQARHYFSFGSYYNPDKMGFGALKVINDDRIGKGKGFATHPHQDMEIITIPLEGSVVHKDSMGNAGEIKAGEVQVMSAGTGVRHSEFNGSEESELKLLQIWIEPDQQKLAPRYEQGEFGFDKLNQWVQLVSPIKKNESGLKINQEAYINRGVFEKTQKALYSPKGEAGGVYLLVVKGSIFVNGHVLNSRDAIELKGQKEVSFDTVEESDVLIFEVPVED